MRSGGSESRASPSFCRRILCLTANYRPDGHRRRRETNDYNTVGSVHYNLYRRPDPMGHQQGSRHPGHRQGRSLRHRGRDPAAVAATVCAVRAHGASGMKLSAFALALLEFIEDYSPVAYPDQHGVWTCGYGHTGLDVKEGTTCTPEQASAWLAADVGAAEHSVNFSVHSVLRQHAFDALVLLTY